MAGKRGVRIRIKMKVDMGPLRAMRENLEASLRAFDEPCRLTAKRIIDFSAFLVPRGGAPNDPLNLADTSFVSGPLHNSERMSTVWTCGYSHPAAGAIHEGFHWGDKTKPPPHWLRKAVRASGARGTLRKGAAKVLQQFITKYATKE